MLDYLDAFWMLIDIRKSWFWTSSQIPKAHLDSVVRLCAHKGQLACVSAHKDLGAVMRYRRGLHLGPMKTRVQEAIDRISRLRHLPLDVHQLWQAIRSSALSAGLYGIETYPLGFQRFQRIRSQIADVQINDMPNRSDQLTCALTCLHIQDPEVQAICQSFRAVRHFLAHNPESQDALNSMLGIASPACDQVFGPVGCLRRWFHRLGWKVLPGGIVCTHMDVTLSILGSCFEATLSQMHEAWGLHALSMISHRKGCQDMPQPDLVLTHRNLPNFRQLIFAY